MGRVGNYSRSDCESILVAKGIETIEDKFPRFTARVQVGPFFICFEIWNLNKYMSPALAMAV